HGPSLAALCLRVDDVAGAAKRAEMLSIASFEGRVGRGEMKIPAVRDPAGALIYLVEAGGEEEIWRRDFVAVAPEQQGETGAGLIAFDHIAFATSDQEILSWLLYYFALFEIEKRPLVEVPDPQGLVQSQPVESPDRALRLVINGSTAPGTLSSRLLRRYWGAGVQYLSFATDDIFAAAGRIEALGLERLPIPANYYDDLEARFGLPADTIAVMARHSILYDRDDQGEYWQLSSRAFRKRFFFEIVQRRAYDGYGSPNELTRLAAQSRFRDEAELDI
ncbi:MAG: 3-keto-5-aminohexanoate cleavage protein, partial [Alphaproteobacteria bacterium]|nr:3-keto-5-aminohexanoate cleavage protein [Alphaproteobacteria bacterium]